MAPGVDETYYEQLAALGAKKSHEVLTVLRDMAVAPESTLQGALDEAVGVMLADAQGELHLVTASDERTRLLELFALQCGRAPCYREGTARLDVLLEPAAHRSGFPRLAARARQQGFATTHALPMRLRHQVVGVLNLFDSRERKLGASDARVSQALAEVAAIAVLQHRTLVQADLERAQLRSALSSRIVIEQAMGVLAERWHTSPDEAFAALRRYARTHRLPLHVLCRQFIGGSLKASALKAGGSAAWPTGAGRERDRGTADIPARYWSRHPFQWLR
ncbi:GAF and ANTAR domain-containing protein [Streptomyces sp. NPDC055189]